MSLVTKMLSDDNEPFDPFFSLVNKCPVLNPLTDWRETPEAHVFTVDLPGLKKDEVRVEVDEGRVLQISGERKVDDGDKWHRVERCRGKFIRRFKLPENAKTDEMKASMENEVLVVTVPKQAVKKPEKKVIEIQGN